MDEFYVSLSEIVFLRSEDGELLNPRGAVRDTTDLQDSMNMVGQRDAILVVQHSSGAYAVVDGHRRVTAARALGWSTIRVTLDAPVADDNEAVARMLATYVRRDIAPSAFGRAAKRLIVDQRFGIERLAKMLGRSSDQVRLLIDLTHAPETVQRRVDAGEMSLSAWKALRDKPAKVQEEAAALEKPTVRAVRELGREEKSAGVLSDLLLAAEHPLLTNLNALRGQMLAGWRGLTASEQTRLRQIVSDLYVLVHHDLHANTEVA